MAPASHHVPPDDRWQGTSIRLALAPDSTADALVLTVAGEVDFTTCSALVAAAERAIAQRPKVLILDTSGVAFLCVAGYRAILHLSRSAAAGGTAVHLRAPSPAVRRLLELLPTESLPAPTASRRDT